MAFLPLASCATSSSRSVSDHFDGERFFNPYYKSSKTFFSFLGMRLHTSFAKWPESVMNTHQPALPSQLSPGQIAVTYVNHSTVLLQWAGLNILTDPVWSERVSPVSWAGPRRVRKPGLDFDKLPTIHLVLVSHNHYDHMDLATLKNLNEKFHPRFLVALGDAEKLRAIGIENVRELDWWETENFRPDVEVTFTPAQHFSARSLWDRNQSLWGGFMLNVRGEKVYFAGDTGYSPHFREIGEKLGAPDLAFIPIGAYSPEEFFGPMHTNPKEAVQGHLDLKAKRSIGIHFGTFQLTAEAIDQPVIDLEVAKKELGLAPDTFIALGFGQTSIFE